MTKPEHKPGLQREGGHGRGEAAELASALVTTGLLPGH